MIGVRHVEVHTRKRLSGQLGPRLIRATQAVATEPDRVRPIDTIPLKLRNLFFCECDHLRPSHILDRHQNRYRTATKTATTNSLY